MDDPSKNCGPFNDARPVRKFNFSIRVHNLTNQPMKPEDWYGFAVKRGGADAYVCYYGYHGTMQPFPEIPAGDMRDVTFAAFVEQNEAIDYIVVLHRTLGRSNVIKIP